MQIPSHRTLSALALALSAAGCAHLAPETPVAAADCKVAPVTTASATGARQRPVDRLDQRYAEMQLATSDYRMRRLQQPLGAMNTVEDALRDCARAGEAPSQQPDVAPR